MKTKTPVEEIIHYIETRMSMYPELLNLSQRGAYDAYLNVLNISRSKLVFEKKLATEQKASAVMNEQGLLELNRKIFETTIDDLLKWLHENQYLGQIDEPITEIKDAFLFHKRLEETYKKDQIIKTH